MLVSRFWDWIRQLLQSPRHDVYLAQTLALTNKKEILDNVVLAPFKPIMTEKDMLLQTYSVVIDLKYVIGKRFYKIFAYSTGGVKIYAVIRK